MRSGNSSMTVELVPSGSRSSSLLFGHEQLARPDRSQQGLVVHAFSSRKSELIGASLGASSLGGGADLRPVPGEPANTYRGCEGMKVAVTRRVLTVASVLGLVVLSGACAQTSPDGQPTDSSSPTAYDPSAEGADWKPQGEAAVEKSYQDYLTYLQKSMQITNPPDVELVRYVSVDDWPHVISECITSAGFPVRVSQGGVVLDGDIPDEQADAMNLAWYTCQAGYPADQRTQEPLPRVRAEKQYVGVMA